jgi:hypothetical protein
MQGEDLSMSCMSVLPSLFEPSGPLTVLETSTYNRSTGLATPFVLSEGTAGIT